MTTAESWHWRNVPARLFVILVGVLVALIAAPLPARHIPLGSGLCPRLAAASRRRRRAGSVGLRTCVAEDEPAAVAGQGAVNVEPQEPENYYVA